jgi:DNA-binding NtrC family response regulator
VSACVGTLRGRRVLIADSDSSVRQQLSRALLAVDVYCDVASSVPDMLQRLDAETYGVILVDITLPGGDPEQVLARIAVQKPEDRPVVIVVASNPASARSLDVEIVQIVLRRPLSLGQTVEVISSCVGNAPDAAADGNNDQLTV